MKQNDSMSIEIILFIAAFLFPIFCVNACGTQGEVAHEPVRSMDNDYEQDPSR